MKKTLAPLMLAGLLLLGGCATSPSNPYDPYESYNRKAYAFNATLDRNLIKPVAEGYRAVTPSPVRTAVGNFYANIKDVFSMVSNVLRAEPEKALNDLMRVSINSTFGLFGLIDIATPAGLADNKTTLGDTFATWGWKQSNYLVLPLLGPSTVRDGTGLGLSLSVPGPEQLVYHNTPEAVAFYGIYGVSQREKLLGLEQQIDESSLDAYTFTRDAYMQVRAKEIGVALPKDSDEEDIDIDELVDSPTASAPAAEAPPAGATPASKP